MTRKILTLVLTALLVCAQAARPARAQVLEQTDAAKVEKTKKRVGKYAGRRPRIEVKLFDGRKLKGNVRSVAAEDFVLLDRKAGVVTTIRYAQVKNFKHVRSGNQAVVSLVGIGVVVTLLALTPVFLKERY